MTKGVHLPRITLDCAHCGNSFSRVGSDTDRRHCSWACARAAKVKHPRRTITCERCGKTKAQTNHMEVVQRYCSQSCARRHLNQEKRETSLQLGFALNARVAKQLLLDELAACRDCGWAIEPAILEMHHLDRNRHNNRRSNQTLLCPNCHTLMHYRSGTGQFANNVGRHG